MAQFWHAYFEDTRTQVLLLLVVLDLVLGVAAAVFTNKNFRLSFVGDFARNDLIGKALPFAVVYAGYLYANNADLVIPGLDMEVVMNGAWGIVSLALVGSLLSSLRDLKIPILINMPDETSGPDPETAVVPTTE